MEFSTWICNEVFFSLLYSFLLLLFQVLRLLLVSSLQTICNILQLQPLYNSLQAFDLNISKLRYYLIPDIWISSVFKKNSCNFITISGTKCKANRVLILFIKMMLNRWLKISPISAFRNFCLTANAVFTNYRWKNSKINFKTCFQNLLLSPKI